MREFVPTMIEALAVCAAGLALGLAVNATRADGIELDRDYFMALPVRAAAADAQAQEQAVRERLQSLGIGVLEHDEAAALFQDELYREGAYVFVDARSEDKWKAGHIPGALVLDHYHHQKTIESVMAAIQTAGRVVVYCHGKDCTDSELCAQLLKNFGVDPSILGVYLGGYATWVERGMPVETAESGS